MSITTDLLGDAVGVVMVITLVFSALVSMATDLLGDAVGVVMVITLVFSALHGVHGH